MTHTHTHTNTNTNTEQERAEFEERFKHLDLTQEPDAWGVPRYKHAAIWLAWEAWQAARSAQVVAQGFRDEAAKEQQAEWQPIETAPNDSSYVLLAGKYRNDVASGYWLQSAYAGNGAWIWPFVHKCPTHWMPLPPPPTSAEGVEHG